jgi:hypothetical protein
VLKRMRAREHVPARGACSVTAFALCDSLIPLNQEDIRTSKTWAFHCTDGRQRGGASTKEIEHPNPSQCSFTVNNLVDCLESHATPPQKQNTNSFDFLGSANKCRVRFAPRLYAGSGARLLERTRLKTSYYRSTKLNRDNRAKHVATDDFV